MGMHIDARKQQIALLISAFGYSITLSYLLFGGTSNGKKWFRSHTPNAGVLLLIVFTLPLFVAHVASILFLKDGAAEDDIDITRATNPSKRQANRNYIYNRIKSFLRRIRQCPRLFTIAYMLVPCVIFFLCSARRHYLSAVRHYPLETNSIVETNYQINAFDIYQLNARRWAIVHHVSNCAAIVGLIAFSHLLIPVSKHSPLIVLLNWTPQEALLMHKYAGRLAIVGVGMHGLGHLMHAYWRWWSVFVSSYEIIDESDVLQNKEWMEKSFWRGFFPPIECWQQNFGSRDLMEIDFGPGCINEDFSCSCLDFWINFTGLLGFIALSALMISSLNLIRRHFYKAFYITHIIAAPAFIIASVLHYKRAIMYMCPSLLYYASLTVPVYIESWLSRWQNNEGSRITSVSKLTCTSRQRPNSNVLSIEFQASNDTMAKFRPGSYCKLQIPSISMVPHPFTVNIVPEHSNRLRIMMRQSGPFTTQVVDMIDAHRKLDDESKECCIESQCPSLISLPTMHITMYNSNDRMAQLHRHEAAIFVAGGIGITPYLSMLMEISSANQTTSSLKSVVLHWICRDASLIRYVHDNYITAMLENCNENGQCGHVSVKIITHYTGSAEEDVMKPVNYRMNTSRGAPVKSSVYSFRNSKTLTSFVAIFGAATASTFYAYTYIQSAQFVSTRIVGLLAICIISIALSVISLLNWSQNTKQGKYLSLSTEESYGSTSCSRKRQGAEYTKNGLGYEYTAIGRPNEGKLFSSLQDEGSKITGVFLCGPSLMVKQLRAYLSMKNHQDMNVYEEIFEL